MSKLGAVAIGTGTHRTRSAALRIALVAGAAVMFSGFAALGVWQLKRLAWKLDLIERVEQRVHAAPVNPPGPDRWSQITAAGDEYRHVQLTGRFLHERETLVQAATELGGGFWVLTPLRLTDGSIVLVNCGFVPPEARNRAQRKASEPNHDVTVTGLLRLTEPGGAFLRRNAPATDRWFSRDVQAIAAARGLANAAPYFIDQEAAPVTAGAASAEGARPWPVAGLTVIAFHNNHLVYAITWFTLALMVAGAAWLVRREDQRPGPIDVTHAG